MTFVKALFSAFAAEVVVIISYMYLRGPFGTIIYLAASYGGFSGARFPFLLTYYFDLAYMVLIFAPIIYLFWYATRNEYDRYEYY